MSTQLFAYSFGMANLCQTVEFVANIEVLVHLWTKRVFDRVRCNIALFNSVVIHNKEMKGLLSPTHISLLTYWVNILIFDLTYYYI